MLCPQRRGTASSLWSAIAKINNHWLIVSTHPSSYACMQEFTRSIEVSLLKLRFEIAGLYWKYYSANRPEYFFASINFHYYSVYYGEKAFGLVFFLQMLCPFKARNLGPFLTHGWQYSRMGLVYFATLSQGFIRPWNKHKQWTIAQSIPFFSSFSLTLRVFCAKLCHLLNHYYY